MRSVLNILYNCHWIVPGEAARSAQPYMGFWEHHLRSNGIRSIINLRGAHPEWGWWQKEAWCCRRLRIKHFNLSMNSRRLPTRVLLLGLLETFDAAPRPFLIKCSGGQDRTSLASALFLLHRYGWMAEEEATKQFDRFPYLHMPRQNQMWLRAFPVFAREAANGTSLVSWIQQQYDPVVLERWLSEHGIAPIDR
ncbi:protein tyrosine/serine phosphatase [Rhizomicrobium palustre]|uniref:Protein tyrosine/serine phosphatase n=1 Tax=Rhizomicrobium palustre TaxID=189966 RepID=A0A846N111_9PROT|nr:dual specificity protein phosphatase family protein [Rhizomicrobium palustre]NIK89165.1 protein tyrosine/serine phosphatase [Rhizomicrobium palustre]